MCCTKITDRITLTYGVEKVKRVFTQSDVSEVR